MDHSVLVQSKDPDPTRRIGLSQEEIVILDQTSNGKYHGHIRAWHELTPSMKQTLVDKGWAKAKTGKIFWPPWALNIDGESK